MYAHKFVHTKKSPFPGPTPNFVPVPSSVICDKFYMWNWLRSHIEFLRENQNILQPNMQYIFDL